MEQDVCFERDIRPLLSAADRVRLRLEAAPVGPGCPSRLHTTPPGCGGDSDFDPIRNEPAFRELTRD
jgi:hypothetical protein